MNRPAIKYLPRSRGFIFWARFLGVAIVLFPLALQHKDFRSSFSPGISISAHKSSPAYAAFEDVREDYAPKPLIIPDHAQLIASGRAFNPDHIPVVRQVALKGMTVRAPAPERAPVVVAAAVPKPLPAIVASRRAAMVESLTEEDLGTTSVSALAASLARNELQKPTVIHTASGTPIYIAKGMSTPAPTRLPLAISLPPSTPVAPRVVANNTPPPPPPSQSGFSTMSTHNPVPEDMRPLWLTGQVEMTGGLAFVGPETQLAISRTFNGRVLEKGRVFVTEGKFEIRVKEPTGFLVAELLTGDGRVLGRGEVNLLDLGQLPKDDHIGDMRIALRPTSEGAMFHVISAYSHGGQKIPVADARVEIQAHSDAQKVDSDGIIHDSGFTRDSSFVARALARDHWPSLAVGQAMEPQDIRLYSNSLVKALLNLNVASAEKKMAAQQSVVWGLVSQNGKAVEGAQLEMAGDYKAIYFSELFLPDPKMTATSKNGLFAFVKVKSGVQAVRVRVGSKVFPAQVFPTEDKHVSYIELDIRDKAISQFKVFDGLDMSRPVSASLRLVGSDEVLGVNRDDFVEYSVAANPFMVEADGGENYEITRVTVTGTPHVVHVPMVQRQWLAQISGARGITPLPDHGTIVGYIDGQDFEVELTGYAHAEEMQIVYFNAQGVPLDSKTGVAGGGFAIFNAPQGLQTLYVHPNQSREIFSQIVVAEPEFVQVVTH